VSLLSSEEGFYTFGTVIVKVVPAVGLVPLKPFIIEIVLVELFIIHEAEEGNVVEVLH
jgi:hypothetical protein